MEENERLLEQILEGQHIKAVYQPIVSLKNGEIYGYEALSRITRSDLEMNIEQMFRTADRMNKSWELETLCRTKAFEALTQVDYDKKLFLNVNSNILHDKKFREGFTKSRLDEYGLHSNNVIFEITERVSVVDSTAFMNSIHHYKSQNYGIAIDDVGAGYSGLNVIANVKPNLIKLDMSLVRNIDKDETKQLLCKAMVDFGKNCGIQLIAEGIETEEELKTLIQLNVDYGQGYFIGIPDAPFADIAAEKIKIIQTFHQRKYNENTRNSIYPTIGHLAKLGHTFSPTDRAETIYEKLRQNLTITDFTLVEDGVAVGFMTRALLNEMFGGRYGYSLHAKKSIRQLYTKDFLRVNHKMPVDQVSRIAMQRSYEQLYNPIVVEKDNLYLGIVTIKDLLNACSKVEIDVALHSNPLTGLPGNLLIEQEILNRVFGEQPYCISYYDIDNFKAYNDAYGFQNGDMMLALLADILREQATKNEFIGHIGGDDFIVISDHHDAEEFCQSIIDQFALRVTALYHEKDIQNGYIISKNRHGVTEKFPIASLSIAAISNRNKIFKSIDDFSHDIALLKKKCKKVVGNYFAVI